MAVYELDSELDDFDLADLADSLKALSEDLNRRVLAQITSTGQLEILGEVAFDPAADALIVKPTKAGRQYWGKILPPGETVVLDDACRSMAQLVGQHPEPTPHRPFEAIDSAGPEAAIWSGQTESELRVRHYDSRSISQRTVITETQFPSHLKERHNASHQHAVNAAYQVGPSDPDHLQPVIVKAVPSDASSSQRQSINRSLVYEYAALQALSRHHLPAAASHLRRTDAGDLALIVERFDRHPVPIQEIDEHGQIKVRSADLGTGAEVIGAQGLSDRLGHGRVEDPFQFLQSFCENKASLNQSWMTRRIFDVLIGNIDHHEANAAVLWKTDAHRVTVSLAPSFDVSPFLLDNSPGTVRESGFSGEVLSDLTLEDVARLDPALGEWLERYPEQAFQAFFRAQQARNEMVKIVSQELCPQGLASEADGAALNGYLTRPLGGGVNRKAASEHERSPSERKMAL